jgi:hypothetical protein
MDLNNDASDVPLSFPNPLLDNAAETSYFPAPVLDYNGVIKLDLILPHPYPGL